MLPRSGVSLDPDRTETIRRLYAAGVLEMGEWLEQVLAALEARGLGERTSLVVTADHGEELMEHGHVGHASTARHATLFEEVLRVPLLVVDPRVSEPRRVGCRVYGPDLYGTLLDLAGLGPCPGASLAGCVLDGASGEQWKRRPLRFHSSRMGYQTPPELAGHSISAESDGVEKRVVEDFGAPRLRVYDLERDPGETAPVRDEPLS